ncbi:ATP-binding protein [Clostridium sp.]|uniref:ATP-binding protein n=1 Tax=Clostridium sp. TaxID=1506 RepID=UPI001A5448EC|nr:ATP-binding protein [Clostridium sp.]MBK5234704.1 hypothetical protein [Clostridium sp.]
MSDTIKSKIDLLRPKLPFIVKEINDRQYIIQPEFNKYGVAGILHALEELIKLNNKSIIYLCEKMKHFSVSPGNYQKLSHLNNEVINIQRELYKKNAIISDLIKTKESLNIELETLNTTKDRIFSIIGHDLRGPLANIIQSVNMIVIDNGVGMPKEKIATFFDLNKNNVIWGTKGEKETGFGLVLCKKLIERNGGLISVLSQNGKGSEFAFTIPLSKTEVFL